MDLNYKTITTASICVSFTHTRLKCLWSNYRLTFDQLDVKRWLPNQHFRPLLLQYRSTSSSVSVVTLRSTNHNIPTGYLPGYFFSKWLKENLTTRNYYNNFKRLHDRISLRPKQREFFPDKIPNSWDPSNIQRIPKRWNYAWSSQKGILHKPAFFFIPIEYFMETEMLIFRPHITSGDI